MRDDDPEDLLGELVRRGAVRRAPAGPPGASGRRSRSAASTATSCTRSGAAVHRAADGRRRGRQPQPRRSSSTWWRRRWLRRPPAPARTRRRSDRVRPRPRRSRPRGGCVLRADDTEQAHVMLGVRGLGRHDPRRLGAVGARAPRWAAGRARGCSSRCASGAGSRTRCTRRSPATPTPGSLSVYAGCAAGARSASSCGWCARCSTTSAAGGLSDAEVRRAQGRAARWAGARPGGHQRRGCTGSGRSELDHGRQRTRRGEPGRGSTR